MDWRHSQNIRLCSRLALVLPCLTSAASAVTRISSANPFLKLLLSMPTCNEACMAQPARLLDGGALGLRQTLSFL
ncbi:hypothetical protein BD324DRAFT_339749 [Kockovaella imperatae]|uniref:Secreted protein n=1 Tax=Kockovaella imperatae TaxID=4999 RepID=A0A1Y1UJK4_9TREE|nr:hypothetical protein BD324DRAFT_339749 [Kockovaella imperatae]ORX38162.1 hypothetical protein BD324DRAFT_339749 [Kockovaella imperatae]